MPKNADIYFCEPCNFKCCKKSNYVTHLATRKHLFRTKSNNLEQENADKLAKLVCAKCSKEYKSRSSLWYHYKKCQQLENEESIKEKEVVDKDLVMMLLKQNAELLEIVKNGTHNITNNTTTNNNNNCHNKSFNLQFFLNETCKNAMNIMDFVNSIQLQLSDLENVGEQGYVKGISNIIVKHLKALDVTQRPVHCSDAKREVLYIKDNDVWEKETSDNSKMRKAVKYISYKNTMLLPLWREKNPDCQSYYSSKNDKYNYMVLEAMGGAGENYTEKEDKIIRNIAKEVVIDK